MQMDTQTAINIWQRAYRIRQVELEIVKRYYPDPADRSQSPMRTPLHLHIGAEVLASTVREVIGADSHCYSTHRAHAHYLAWGGDLKAMIAELYGKATGCAGGWGGSMHLRDAKAGFMGGSPIVGSSLSIAVGDALAAKLAGESRVTVAFVGDAVLETGQWHEAWQFAVLHGLRLAIVIEDNGLSTATAKALRQQPELSEHGVPDVEIKEAFGLAAALAAPDDWPGVARFFTTRFFEHVGVGRDSWREVPELDTDADALYRLAGMLPATYDTEPWKRQVRLEIADAFQYAEKSAWPEAVA